MSPEDRSEFISAILTRRAWVVAILLLAAVLRLYGLNNLSPPGLEHDEVAHWLINQDILAGKHAVYFSEAYGHEAGFHYWQTGFMLLLGDNALALRLPAAFAGLLGVAVSFALTRRLFDYRAALFAAAILAVTLWPIFFSRLALRAISLPLLSGLSAYFWWAGWYPRKRHAPWNGPAAGKRATSAAISESISNPDNQVRFLPFILAGLFAGLSLYTYQAARVVPIFYALFISYLFLFHRPVARKRLPGIATFILALAIVAAPLIFFLLTNQDAEFRIGEVDAPLRALQNGNLRPALENSLRVIGMFGFRGDPLWRQNVADLPVFDPLIAAFFYIGCVICGLKWREDRYLFLILWISTSTIPSIVTIDAPSSIRIINALPVLGVVPVIGWRVIHTLSPLSTVSTGLSTETGSKTPFKLIAAILLGALILSNIYRTVHNLFVRWPAAEEVQFVWQQALTEAAAYLDQSSAAGPVAIGGWTPETMDPPTMELSLKRKDLSLRYFDPTQALIIPQNAAGQSIRLIRPTILPLDSFLERQLSDWGGRPRVLDSFTLYALPPSELSIRPRVPASVAFEDQLTFLGYDPLKPETLFHEALLTPGPVTLVTYWRVQTAPDGPRRFFLHLLSPEGVIVDQDDGAGAPAAFWQPGDILLQVHHLDVPESGGPFSLKLGLFNPDDGARLLTSAGRDSVSLLEDEVE